MLEDIIETDLSTLMFYALKVVDNYTVDLMFLF